MIILLANYNTVINKKDPSAIYCSGTGRKALKGI